VRRPRLSDESGFSLPELLLTMVIGVVVLGAGTMITIGAERHNVEVSDRSDATARGRYALEKMQQLLRSQSCSSASPYPVTVAKPQTVTFYADLSGGESPVYRHTLTYDPVTKTITDTSVKGSAGTPQTFTAAPKALTLATDVVQTAANPVFRYWAYPAAAPAAGALEPNVELVPGAAGLTAAQLGKIARIDINFVTTGTNRVTASKIRAEMTNRVFVRFADPNSTTTFDPSCT
jgi:prepilin-type N-terminal cleavage/methylation domain-containing protein